MDNIPFRAGGIDHDGRIRASGETTCDGDFQSGKRFKQHLTDVGPVDLVFDVSDSGTMDDGASVLRAFHRLVNLTGQKIASFTVQLGFGLGDDFTPSSIEGGLAFAQNLELGPDDGTAFSQFPFGLFGEADTNPRFDLDGFYDNDRAGFGVKNEEDLLASEALSGNYAGRFGGWLSQDMTPDGLLWDNDNDPTTDALVMSAFDTVIGKRETLRSITDDGGQFVATSILSDPRFFDTEAEVLAFLETESGMLGEISLFSDKVEDLANLNLNYGILIDDRFTDDSFTLRVTTTPVPVPPAAPLLAVGVGMIAVLRRKRASLG